ncbi:MAG TPA: hypothetical protein VFS31_00650, partial [Chitinophagaceae bacterium]|nr:hypothetical protein [Chitinophagaceae bacterium]
MKTTFYRNLKAFTLCAGFFSLAACKEKSSVKPDLIPDVDNIHTFEVTTFDMSLKNAYRDSLWTNDYQYQIVGIGGITNDVIFGKTAAGVYMQFAPPSANFTFPNQVIIDSSVLMVPYYGVIYGDTSRTNPNHALRLNAYQITEPFTLGTDGTRKFYSFDKLDYNTVPIGSGTITVGSLVDTIVLANGDTVSNMLRLRMTGALNDQFKTMDPQYLVSPTVFQDHFRGIFLAPDTTQQQNTIAYFELSGAANAANYSIAQMEFYYHTQTDNTPKRSFFRFDVLTSSFFNSIKRNYSG